MLIALTSTDLDLNDPVTLGFYSELMLFKNDATRESLVFPPSTAPADRRTIHTLAHHMALEHRSEGQGDNRYVSIHKRGHVSPPIPQSTYYTESSRRGLNRAATIDFSETRDRENSSYHHSLNRQGSNLLDIPGSPGLGGLSAHNNLRAAKSFADLRSYTPSPVPSTASFPVGLTQNISRYAAEYNHGSAASGTPNLTPTSAGGGMNGREDAFLLNSISNMTIGYDRPNANRTNATGRIGQEREAHNPVTGAIGSQRPVNGTYEDPRNGTAAVRQPQGPGLEWGAGNGFGARPRQNGHVNRGSGELDPNSYDNSWDDNRAQDASDRTGAPQPASRYL